MLDWQIAATWLYSKLQAVSELTDLIGSGASAKAYNADSVPPNVSPPYLTVKRVSALGGGAIGGKIVATTCLFDIAIWDQSSNGQDDDDTRITPAIEAINDVLGNADVEFLDGHNVSSAEVADMPPAPPPQNAGDPVMVRLGKTYEVFVADAS